MKSVYRPCYKNILHGVWCYNLVLVLMTQAGMLKTTLTSAVLKLWWLVFPPLKSSSAHLPTASDLLLWVHITRPMLIIFNTCCYKLFIHTSLQCLHNNVPEIRFFYLKYMLQYSISFYYIVTYCMCLFISSCVPVRCGSVPAGWVWPYSNNQYRIVKLLKYSWTSVSSS